MNHDLASPLPDEPIAAIRQLAESERELERLRFVKVKQAREAGRSWEVIASALGVSRQSAWQYYAPKILKEFDREENRNDRPLSDEVMEAAVSECRALRRHRRNRSA